MTIQKRLAQLDWKAIEASLWQRGYAKIGPLLTVQECEALIALYNKDEYFRSRIEMRRFRFGEGEYKYFIYPLPPLVQALRKHIYPRLAIVANAWSQALGEPGDFPMSHDQLLTVCRQHGQTKPTPLVLHYTAGGTTASIRISMGTWRFLCSSPCFSVVAIGILPGASFYSWNSDRALNHVVKCWPQSREKW